MYYLQGFLPLPSLVNQCVTLGNLLHSRMRHSGSGHLPRYSNSRFAWQSLKEVRGKWSGETWGRNVTNRVQLVEAHVCYFVLLLFFPSYETPTNVHNVHLLSKYGGCERCWEHWKINCSDVFLHRTGSNSTSILWRGYYRWGQGWEFPNTKQSSASETAYSSCHLCQVFLCYIQTPRTGWRLIIHMLWPSKHPYTWTSVSHLTWAKWKSMINEERLSTAVPFFRASPLYKTIFNWYEIRYCQPARNTLTSHMVTACI